MRRRRLLAAGALLAAIAGGYLLGRTAGQDPPAGPARTGTATSGQAGSAPPQIRPPAATRAASRGSPLPPAGAPLRGTFAALQARARAGDAAAASRLVRDLDRCHRLRDAQRRNSLARDRLAGKSTEAMTPAQLRTYEHLLDAAQLRQQSVREDEALCAGVGEKMLDALVEGIAQAARLGDAQARACYLDRGPLYDAHGLLAHPESLRGYRADARAMIRAGLDAGDWRVVDLLQQAYRADADGLLAAALGADPVEHYRYLRLYRLGAEAHRVAALDRALAAAAAGLDSAQIAQADAWAQRTLREDFRGASTGVTPPGWRPCGF